MKIQLAGILSVFVMVAACRNNTTETGKAKHEKPELFTITEIIETNNTPNVDIKKYTLITRPGEDRSVDASEILKVKRKWPLAMQSQKAGDFDSILSQHFIFTDNGKLLNRADYIKNRTATSDWVITHVVYNNLTLQFFGETALLTYNNEVTNKKNSSQEVEMEYISWADVYQKENGHWKIASAHVVDFRMEPQ